MRGLLRVCTTCDSMPSVWRAISPADPFLFTHLSLHECLFTSPICPMSGPQQNLNLALSPSSHRGNGFRESLPSNSSPIKCLHAWLLAMSPRCSRQLCAQATNGQPRVWLRPGCHLQQTTLGDGKHVWHTQHCCKTKAPEKTLCYKVWTHSRKGF